MLASIFTQHAARWRGRFLGPLIHAARDQRRHRNERLAQEVRSPAGAGAALERLVSPVTLDAGFALAWIAVRCESWSRAVRAFRQSSVCSLQAGSAGARMPTRGRKE